MKIRNLLILKNRPVIAIGPGENVSSAIRKLAEYERGSIPVCNEKGELVGIITERDIVRKCFNSGGTFADLKIQDVMTKQVAFGTPEDDLEYAVSVMKQKRIRHLPIMDGQEVVGLVSMRDLLDVQLNEVKAEVRYTGLLPKRMQRHLV